MSDGSSLIGNRTAEVSRGGGQTGCLPTFHTYE